MNRARRRAVALLVALVVIFLASGAVALMSLAVRDLAATSRLESDRAVVRQVVDSGVAWLEHNRGAAEEGRPIKLDISAIVPTNRSGTLTITRGAGPNHSSEVLRIEAVLSRDGNPVARRVIAVPTQP